MSVLITANLAVDIGACLQWCQGHLASKCSYYQCGCRYRHYKSLPSFPSREEFDAQFSAPGTLNPALCGSIELRGGYATLRGCLALLPRLVVWSDFVTCK